MFLGHLGAGFDAHPVAQTGEALADESTWWCSGFGVVPRQRGCVLRRPVGLNNRAHEVLVAVAQGHPPDRHRHRQPPPFRHSTDALTPSTAGATSGWIHDLAPATDVNLNAIMPVLASGARSVGRRSLLFGPGKADGDCHGEGTLRRPRLGCRDLASSRPTLRARSSNCGRWQRSPR